MESQAQHLTPLAAIRAKCLDCCGQSYSEVHLCTVNRCLLWPYRLGKSPDFTEYQGRNLKDEIVTMKVAPSSFQALKAKCQDCGGPDSCTDGYSWCPLFKFWEQRRNKPRRVLSEEARAQCLKNLEAINARRSAQAQ